MGTLVVVAAVVAVVAFAAARSTARHNMGLRELECLAERVELDGATVKAVVAAVDVMGGTVTVAEDAAKEALRNKTQTRKNEAKIFEAQLAVKQLTGDNQQLRGRSQQLEQLVSLLPPAPAKS